MDSTVQTLETGERQVLYKTRGTCSQYMDVAVKDGRVTRCIIHGGCMGNTQGLSALVVGMKVEDVMAKLNGIRCGYKGTSCPDQLCRALEQVTE